MPRVIARFVESRHSLMHSACKGLAVVAVVVVGTILPPSGSPVFAQAHVEKPEQPVQSDSERARDAAAKQGIKSSNWRTTRFKY